MAGDREKKIEKGRRREKVGVTVCPHTHTSCVYKGPFLRPLTSIHSQISQFVGYAKMPHFVSSLDVHDNPRGEALLYVLTNPGSPPSRF